MSSTRQIGQCDATDGQGRPCILVTAHATPHAANRDWDWTMDPEHPFVPVPGQTGCARCGYARGHHPNRATRDYPITLPTCEPCRPGESIVDHGARVLTFLLQTSCTATLSDLELERADVAAKYAITARGISVTGADRISDARHLIAFMLAERKQLDTMKRTADGGQLTGKLGTGGPGDREPLQPKPKDQPPVGDAPLRPVADLF